MRRSAGVVLIATRWALAACEECALLQHQASPLPKKKEVLQQQSADAPEVVFRLTKGPCADARLGNLMFEWGSLIGLASMAGAGAKVCWDPSVHVASRGNAFHRDFSLDRIAGNCSALPEVRPECAMHWKEAGHTRYNQGKVDQMLAGIRDRQSCSLVEVSVTGCLQTWKYFDDVKDGVREAFSPPAAHQAEASKWLAEQREELSKKEPGVEWLFAGVQVRLGDKSHPTGYVKRYAPNGWSFFGEGMRSVRKELQALHPKAKVAFAVTVGGALGGDGSSEAKRDRERAKEALARECPDCHLIFTEGKDMMTDFAVLTSTDALVVGASTFGWWSAYLSKASQMPGLVAAPRHIYSRSAGGYFRNFHADHYYPPTWTLINNLDEEEA